MKNCSFHTVSIWFLLLFFMLHELIGHTVSAWPLDSCFARGDSGIAITWTPDSSNVKADWYVTNGTLCTGADTVFLHSDFIAGTTYTSIAYSYGGEDPWYLFRSKLKAGLCAGSHLCHYKKVGDPSSAVAGTDCSGYACFLWNVPRMSTTQMVESQLFQKITYQELRPGDCLVKAGSHVVFVVEADDSTEVVIWESTSVVFGCRERVIDVTQPYWKEYQPIRYPQITAIEAESFLHNGQSIRIADLQVLGRGVIRIENNTRNRLLFCYFSISGQCLGTYFINPGVFNHAIDRVCGSGVRILSLRAENGRRILSKRLFIQ
ncbi:MAG: hypothetical protein JW795_02460 [Chitinivibrionales bacterium]|nr:hypothetical protein [Chitinivibrionales bacterium]